MLKPEDRPLFGALILLAAAILVLALVKPFDIAPNGCGLQAGNAEVFKECVEIVSAQSVAEYTRLLAWFTAILAAFTIVLAGASVWQGYLTRNSIKLARDEFNATHRPKIFVHTVSVTDQGSRTLRNGQRHHTPARGIITVANGGDASAFIIEWCAVIYYQSPDAAFTPGLDVEPVKYPKTDAAGISPGRFEKLGHSQMHVIDDEWTTFVAEKGKMFFLGKITYQGADGIKRSTGFCRQYDPEDAGAWRPVKESEYEYAY